MGRWTLEQQTGCHSMKISGGLRELINPMARPAVRARNCSCYQMVETARFGLQKLAVPE
jgi:hypothetical protein